MLDSLSVATQLILTIIGIAILFFLVFANNRRNKRKEQLRKQRNFQKNYTEKKKEKEKNPQ